MRKRKITSYILLAVMLTALVLPIASVVSADEDTVIVSSADDLILIAKNCTLDTWSQGKRVILANDIDLNRSDFKNIPTFGGTFEGNGHKISGFSYGDAGSYIGFFRYIQEGGRVNDLHISGYVQPSGSKNYIGGIAGSNSGIISGCEFEGSVGGTSAIGGIAGINNDKGQILYSTVSASVSGEKLAGGIAGKNTGLIQNCSNSGNVNNSEYKKKNDLSNIDTDINSALESAETKKDEEQGEESVLPSYTDVGGIAGFSSGVVQGCKNYGRVGYQHMGYNIGGVVGRQSGYIIGCENYGSVYGRKDVGGIVGQAEPYILLDVTESALKNLDDEIDKLQKMVNNFTSDTDATNNEVSAQLKKLSGSTGSARDSAKEMMDSLSDYIENDVTGFINDNVAEINAKAAVLTDAADDLSAIFDKLSSVSDDLKSAIDDFTEAIDMIEITRPDLDEAYDEMQKGLSDLALASSGLADASKDASKALSRLQDAVVIRDYNAVAKALEDLGNAIVQLSQAKQAAVTAINKIVNIISQDPNFWMNDESKQQILEGLKEVAAAVDASNKATEKVNTAIKTILSNVRIDFDSIRDGISYLKEACDDITHAMKKLTRGVGYISNTLNAAHDTLKDYIDAESDKIDQICDKLSSGSKTLSGAADELSVISQDAADALKKVTDAGPINFVKLNDDYHLSSDALFDSLTEISNDVSKIEDSVKNGGDKMTSHINKISEQINVILRLFTDEAKQIDDRATDFSISELITDVSDEDINNTKQGKIDSCTNYAQIEADRNVGGVAGTMAIDYSSDPEEDIEKPDALNFTYKTKAVLQKCVNSGSIIGKKDDIGGVCGRMDLGTILGCENYSSVKSENGNYVGGIAGYSNSSVRKSYSKSSLEGERGVGGVAGRSDVVTSCYSISDVNGSESIGSVSGEAKDTDGVRDNFFIDKGVGGIDAISYSNHAEPISYEKLSALDGIPLRFSGFTVKFVADGEVLETREVEYGKPTRDIKCPDIPSTKDCFGVWPDFPTEYVDGDIVLEAEYKHWITTLSSVETNEKGTLSLGLAEGKFTDKATLHIQNSDENPAAQPKLEETVVVWKVSLSNADIGDNDTVPIRLINEKKSKYTIWQKTDGGWTKISAKSRGKYIKTDMQGREATYCILYTPTKASVLFIVICVIAIAAAGVAIFLVRRRIKIIIKHIAEKYRIKR